MFNKGIKDEESIYIDSTLKALHSLAFVPQFWNIDDIRLFDRQLAKFGLTLNELNEYQEEQLIILLQRLHLNYTQLEQLADILLQISNVSNYQFDKKSLAIYNYIQQNNTTFSVGIMTKITSAKAKIKNHEG